MPLRYASELAEHRAVREAAGLFDLSHMGELRVSGTGTGEFLNTALVGDLAAVEPGRAKYTLLVNADGGIIDDLIGYRLGDDEYLVVPNAGNAATAVADALGERAEGFDVAIADETASTALLAVQGPAAATIVAGLADDPAVVDGMRYYRAAPAVVAGAPVLLARTGYTGEDGFELYAPNERAVELWEALVAAGEPHGLVPAGLAARDSLRLEAGMPLYGNELSLDVNPFEAGSAASCRCARRSGSSAGRRSSGSPRRARRACSSGGAAPVGARRAAATRCTCRSRRAARMRRDRRMRRARPLPARRARRMRRARTLPPSRGGGSAPSRAASPARPSAPRSRWRSSSPGSTSSARGSPSTCAASASRSRSSSFPSTGGRSDRRPKHPHPPHRRSPIMSTVKTGLRYSADHEWVADGPPAEIGISQVAADRLGEIVYVDLPEVGASVTAGETMGEIESTKSVAELYAPVSGEVVEVNSALVDDPAPINDDAYAAWLVRVEVADEGELMSAEEYAAANDVAP